MRLSQILGIAFATAVLSAEAADNFYSETRLEGLLTFTRDIRARNPNDATAKIVWLQLHGESAKVLFENIGPSYFLTYGQQKLTCEGRRKERIACMKLINGDYACNLAFNMSTGEARTSSACGLAVPFK